MSSNNIYLQFGNGLNEPGYQEIIECSPVVIVRLIRDGDAGVEVLHEGAFRTRRTLKRTVKSIEATVADWPSRASLNTLPSIPKPFFKEEGGEDVPTSALSLLLRQGSNLAQLLWSLLFVTEEWNVGIIDAPVDAVLRDGVQAYNVKWFPKAPKGDFYADPFGVQDEDGLLHIVFEAYRYNLGCAELVQTTLNQDGKISDIRPFITEDYHMSFPFLLESKGNIYCVPETHDFGCVQAFPITKDQNNLIAGPPEVLLEGVRITDPVVFTHEDRWWLMGSDAEGLNLFAWYGVTEKGPWTPHRANPIKSDIRSTRPAGPVFSIGDKLLRPAQDGSQSYGGAVIVNQIVTLTPDHFEEKEFSRISPNSKGPYPDGLHSFVPVGQHVLIDGKKRGLHPFAFWRRFISKGN